MSIRVRAALYAIAFFVGIFLLGIAINAIIPYLESWMGWTALFAFLFYMVYSLMLTSLQFDASITRVATIEPKSEKPKEELLQE